MVPCVVGALTVSMLRKCKNDGNAGVGTWGGVVTMSAGSEYMSGIRGSCVVSSADVVLCMSVVRGVSCIGGVCEMCRLEPSALCHHHYHYDYHYVDFYYIRIPRSLLSLIIIGNDLLLSCFIFCH